MVDIGFVIAKYYSGHGFYIDNNDYETLKWYEENTITKPTLEELTEKWNEYLTTQPWEEFRQERNQRLADVDWIFSEDYSISDESYRQWLTYRKALRDLPAVTEDPANPVWPEKPAMPSGTTETKDYTRELQNENTRLKNKVAILENRQTHYNTLLVNLTGRIETLERGA